jgi:RNA polymerase sigma factor (sigma-70 family)
MDDLPEADRYLLDGIGRGDADAWAQLVGRYHGRLLAFARGRLGGGARLGGGRAGDAEDLVQDTFAAFIGSFRSARWDADIETYLFTVLRRRLIDTFRGRGTGGLRVCSIHDPGPGGAGTDGDDGQAADLPGGGLGASSYARRDEAAGRLTAALAAAVKGLADRLKDEQNLNDLRVVEAVFYAQVRNKDAAALCGTTEGRVAVLKHRCLKEIQARVATALGPKHGRDAEGDSPDATESLLTEAWERLRPTCPKRSTLGRHLLGTLSPEWQAYVTFHATALGCRFCQANLADLRRGDSAEPRPLRERFFQSTVGFLTPLP